MRVVRRVLAVSAAFVVAMASGIPVARADSTPSVYTTPGGQISNGRLWNTTCEKYSSNVVRCRAEIWATTVTYVKGRYVAKTGWVFNNLSYLPSPRASWATNDLGRSNPGWTSGGRQWKTECDTPATGRGGCRTYMWVKTVATVKSGAGNTYVNKDAWVFNNLVLFSSAKIPAVSVVPNWVVDCPGQYIGPKGLKCSPVRLGANVNDLIRLGYVRKSNEGTTFYYPVESQSLKDRGVWMEYSNFWYDNTAVDWVSLETGFIPTEAGARVGMTVGQIKAIYGSTFAVVPKKNHSDTEYYGTYREGAYELQFRVAGENGPGRHEGAPTRPLVDSDVIVEITAQLYTDDVSYDVY